jgi:probable rRNA maturation factor
MAQDRAIPRLRVLVSDEQGRRMPDGGLGRWLARVAPARACGVVGVVLARDVRVRALNRDYRGHDRPTDVLAFPADPLRPGRRPRKAATSSRAPYIGDVVIARGVARRQARRAGHPDSTELRVLALHGLLHLLGYDHHGPGRERMARVERRLRARGGLHEGLIERAHGSAR